MNREEARKQIDQMMGFIMKEAEERVADIKRETDNEAEAKRLERERVVSAQLRDEYARKKKERLVQQRIQRSQKKNEARVKVMRARDDVIREIREEVVAKLADVSQNAKYPELIRFLIAQGLMIMAETRVVLQCRKEDEKLVRGQIEAAKQLYVDFITTNTGITPKVAVEVSADYLHPGPIPGRKGLSCCGGIVLSARGGQIVCRNTLDSRLDLCFDNLIPQVRGLLWGLRAPPVRPVEVKQAHGGH